MLSFRRYHETSENGTYRERNNLITIVQLYVVELKYINNTSIFLKKVRNNLHVKIIYNNKHDKSTTYYF